MTTLIELVKRTQEKICAIKESIKGQAKKVLWHDYKKCINTASNVKPVMVCLKAGKIPNVSSLLKTFLKKKHSKETTLLSMVKKKIKPVTLQKFEKMSCRHKSERIMIKSSLSELDMFEPHQMVYFVLIVAENPL